MSANDEKEKLFRSIKLCQLVYDRQSDSEIGFEIRKLSEEGVFIDYQDQNRNKKTVIHLAVEKKDVICLKFLLRFKPNLGVKDGDGKTPVEFANLNGFQSILNVLVNSTVDVMNESFFEVIDYESLTRQKLEAIKSRPTFKVLKLTNCPSVNDVWRKLNDQDYTTTLNESSHLFFIAIETDETNIKNDHDLMKKALKVRRPIIVQLTSTNSKYSQISFKDDLNDFAEINETPQMTREDFDKAAQSENCDFKLLVTALRSNLFGHSTGDLLATKLITNVDRKEAVDQLARKNALCHRFLKLFDESPTDLDRTVATLSFEGDKSLLALLDLPFEPKDGKLKLNKNQQDILTVVDSSGCDLLMIAAELNNLDAVKLLLRCGCDVNHSDNYDVRASDICWEMKAFECLAELIEAGSPYPNNFCIKEEDDSSEAHKRINKMIEDINSFHEHIKQGENDEVKMFLKSHPHIKHGYDTKNKCALTVALESKEVNIHSLLLSEGFKPGADDEYRTACSKSKFKNEIRDAHRKYFKEAFNEPHLKRLSKMSRLSFDSKDREKCSAIIRKMFDELNEIDEVIAILQICSTSEKLQIVFDFNCNSIVDMDPISPLNALGAVYPSEGFVYIGAKNHEAEFFKVIGTLIHELTHYAMKLTYENSCKPYDEDDTESENRFENISMETKKICDVNPSTDKIVTKVFNCYSDSVWHQELIVRVPQLLAHFKKNSRALQAAERNTSELFHFYREKTLEDVETQSKTLLQEHLISKINNQTGISRKIENLKVEFESAEIYLKPSVNVISSNALQLTLAMVKQAFPSNSHIFVTLEQVATGNILDKIAKVNAKESSNALIVDCIRQTHKYPESLRNLSKNVKNIKTIALVMTEDESSAVKANFSKVEFKTFAHKWDELTESSKVILLNQNVIFQGFKMILNGLVEPSSQAMNFFPLDELSGSKNFKIGNELHQTSHKFYIPRKFIRKGQERPTRVTANARSLEQLLRDESRMATIISDEAGSGKSVTLFEIAKKLHEIFPDQWVQFVDLKRHIEAFKGVDDYENIGSFEDFIAQNILKSETKFDQELFKQMFRDGKTFVLFDGFDEISPNYKTMLLHVLKLFNAGLGNQLYISSRPHLEADLKGALGNFVFKLEKFAEDCQTSFLREYWHSVGFEMSHKDFEVLSKRLLDKFSKFSSSSIVGLPLLMRMTAEIFEDPSKENLMYKVDSLSITSVFKDFVEKYLARWTNNENEIARKETVEFVMAGGVLEVHHNFAMNYFVDGEFMSFDVDEGDAEKISRVGLIRFDKTEKTFQFIHETFAEYFVADFIWFHLNRKNQNDSHYCRKAVEALIKVLVCFNFKTEVIRNFLDQTLEIMNFSPSEAFCKSVANYLSESLTTRNCFDLLVKSLRASRKNLSLLLLSIVKFVEKNVLWKMLRSKTNGLGSALLVAAAVGNSVIVSMLCNIITTCTDNPKGIFKDKNFISRNVLSRAAINRNSGVLTTVCEYLNSVLSKDEIKIMFHRIGVFGQSIINIASENSNNEVLPELLSLLPNYLSTGEIKSLLVVLDSSKQNFFHRAVNRVTSDRLKLKLGIVKSIFDLEEQKTFFYRSATALNMFQCAVKNRNEKIFETLIEATSDVFSSDEIKSMLMEKDFQGSNLLHIIAEHGNDIGLNELSLLLRERLSDDEIRNLLLEVSSMGGNCFRLAANNTKMSPKIFCENIGTLISIEDQTRLLQPSSVCESMLSAEKKCTRSNYSRDRARARARAQKISACVLLSARAHEPKTKERTRSRKISVRKPRKRRAPTHLPCSQTEQSSQGSTDGR